MLPEVGEAGQRKLKSSSVLIVGAGGLGSPAALYLAAAGVGRLGLVDFDRVEASNLQRQVLFGESSLGAPKAATAAKRLADLNPLIEIDVHGIRLGVDNALDLVRDYDVVIDGSDNFPTRYLVNDACALTGRPEVYGSIHRFEGQVSVFHAGSGPCYRCLFAEPPPEGLAPNCAEAGVLGVLPGIVGALQSAEAIKLILGTGTPLIGRLLLVDVLEMRFRELALAADPACALCGSNPTIRELREVEASCAAPPAAPAEAPAAAGPLTPEGLSARLSAPPRPLLLDVRSELEWRICRLDGAMLMPLAELSQRIGELDPAQEIVVYCHVGARSAFAADYLRRAGFPRVRNLLGGIDAWAERMDPSMPRY